MDDIFTRYVENLIGRLDGPMHFRFILQPAVATVLAIRAGLRDAREDRPAFLWTVLTKPEQRRESLIRSWKDIGKVLIVAVVLDVIYQVIVHRAVYIFELLTTAALLAFVPYVLVHGPVNRIARRLNRARHGLNRGSNQALDMKGD
jgi:hypothetical protein